MAAISVRMPSRTEIAIADAMMVDKGARFRVLQEKWFGKLKDAFNPEEESGRRSHYGFSGAGETCDRALWMRWRWMNRNEFAAATADDPVIERITAMRMLRLVNRGHLEEARFLALLELIGAHVEDPTVGQERVSAVHGHAGSALDALMYNTPDIPNEWQLGEFKTANDRNFKELVQKGVRAKKPEHFVQMQLCMAVRGIYKTLYMVVNKNDDDIYTEVVDYDAAFAAAALKRIERIIYTDSAPAKISSDPTWWQCKFCDCKSFCQTKTWEPEQSCRSCVMAIPCASSKNWLCGLANNAIIPSETIPVGCQSYRRLIV